MVQASVNSGAIHSFLILTPELIPDSLKKFTLEDGLMSGLQDCMRVVIGY